MASYPPASPEISGAAAGHLQTLLTELTSRHAQGRILDVAPMVDLEAFENPEFHDRLQRAQVGANSRPWLMTSNLVTLAGAFIGVVRLLVALATLQPRAWRPPPPRWPSTLDAVVAAAVQSGADGFLSELPEGYETMLGRPFDGGHELSIGQWQRVALARAFFRGPPFLILDEPTAALDPRAEHGLFERGRPAQADFRPRRGRSTPSGRPPGYPGGPSTRRAGTAGTARPLRAGPCPPRRTTCGDGVSWTLHR